MDIQCGPSALTCAHGSEHTDKGNQFTCMGMVKLTKCEIIDSKLSVDRKPTNMESKMLLEAELYEKLDKYFRKPLIW